MSCKAKRYLFPFQPRTMRINDSPSLAVDSRLRDCNSCMESSPVTSQTPASQNLAQCSSMVLFASSSNFSFISRAWFCRTIPSWPMILTFRDLRNLRIYTLFMARLRDLPRMTFRDAMTSLSAEREVEPKLAVSLSIMPD